MPTIRRLPRVVKCYPYRPDEVTRWALCHQRASLKSGSMVSFDAMSIALFVSGAVAFLAMTCSCFKDARENYSWYRQRGSGKSAEEQLKDKIETEVKQQLEKQNSHWERWRARYVAAQNSFDDSAMLADGEIAGEVWLTIESNDEDLCRAQIANYDKHMGTRVYPPDATRHVERLRRLQRLRPPQGMQNK